MRRLLGMLLLVVILGSVNAQTNTGNIEGEITTPEGNPVPNVNVSIKGQKKHAVTNDKGYFEFTQIPYGDYVLIYSFEGETSQEVPVTVPPATAEASKYNLSLNARELKEVIVRIGGSINQGTANIGKAHIPIMDLPQAVTIIGQSTIENQQAQRLSDVVKNVNGVYLGGARASTQETFYARGYNLGNTNTFKNGFRVNSGAMPEMSAIESVEVLKGGAALLYGNVAPGGIINMITKKPRFNFGGEINMRVGSYDLYKPAVDIYGPISKSIAYRLNGTYEKANSYRDNVHSERFYVNPSLLFKLSEKTKLLVQGDYLQHEFTPDFGIGTMNADSSKPAATGGKRVTPVSRNTFFGAPWQYAKTKQATVSVELNHQFNDRWALNALGGYQNYERDYFSTERIQADISGKWKRPLGKTNNQEDYVTGQLNLNGDVKTGAIGHKLLIGADVEKVTSTALASNIATVVPKGIYDSINLLDPAMYIPRTEMPQADWITSTKNPVTRFGAYVQDLVTLSAKFKLLAGLRWSFQQADRSKTTTLATNAVTEGALLQIDKAFSPRLGLVYQPTNHTTAFASYSNSFSPNSGQDIDSNTLKPSIIDQFEIGIKNDFFDGLLSANLTLYRIINNNLSQPVQFLKNGDPVIGTTTLRELTGQTTSDGIEIDLKSQPVRGWDILAGYSYNNMRYTKTSGKVGSYIEDERLVNSPAHTANATTFYTFQKGSVKGLKLGAGVYYVGERNAGWNTQYALDDKTKEVYLNDRLFKVKGFATVDVSAGYTYRKWSLLAKLANVTNTFNYYVHENYSINPIPSRNFVLTAAFKF
ncbi:TonB-dependent receptor [Niabella beijingensis]|uniref:TonB-dependent receptor n=1 Tax=Niabella beijingensis TaxID=2872700 RepID=UPI001CBE0A86|nr:TonB-dependent receptor [Niabella beijingensis]MBZ4188419.1 TonB-dependent receptor [Niabella beijingensis]